MVSEEQAAAGSDWSEWGVNLSPSARYVAAVAMCAVALVVRLVLIPAEFGFPFLTFYPAVIFSALLLGPGPGFLALTLCAAAGRYFFMPPHWSFAFVWEDVFAVMIFFVSGGVICLLMTSIRRRTADLRQREARLRGLYELSPVGIALTDMQGHYLEFNAAFQRMCGYPSDELKALDYWALTPKAYAADEQRQLELLNANGVYGPYEKEYIRRDGSRIPIRLHGSLIRGEGHQHYIWSIIEDITERRHAEADLARYRDHLEQLVVERTEQLTAAKEAAESANLAKSAFLANMSHEIRTPLNAISGMAHLVRRSGVTPQQAERLDKLEIASKHLLQLINAILDLSKIEAGHFALDESVVDFDSVISDVRAMLQDKVQDKGLQLIIEATQLPSQVLCDPTRLKQALLNYASNAIKFTEHGTITLRVTLQEETANSVLLRFELQDTGIGIAPQDLGRLFNAFEQVDNSMTRKYGGSGLGLSITKRLAQLMGGDAGAISTPGVGSTFWFTARLKKVAGGASATPAFSYVAAAAAHHEFAAMRILLVEDEPVNREITQAMLDELKLRVDCAEDGREALALVEKNTYDLILMDMQMPHMDGLTATSHIRQLAQGAKVPILALTANAFETDRERCMSVGMNDFIVKPFTADVLFAKLLKWLPHSVT